MKNDILPGNLDIHLFHEGNHIRCHEFLGSHLTDSGGESGVRFTLWAPHAREVRVIGDFNGWQGQNHVMSKVSAELWTLFVPKLIDGDLYKYEIITTSGISQIKSDPFAFAAELRPLTASRIVDLQVYDWTDEAFLAKKQTGSTQHRPVNIYEVHLGSWRRRHDDGAFLNYQELARELVSYVKDMGFTHIELMPITEHPLDASWGYQSTGYYAVTSRYGSPLDFMEFVNSCHEADVGVILDWVPGHFCRDAHGLRLFDGEPLFESGNLQLADNEQWGTTNFDYGRPEVQSFLTSNALFWFENYHVDGLRVDAVASMLYLDYGKKRSWTPNKYGGRENLEAVTLLKKINEAVYKNVREPLLIAEESTSWPLVTKPTYVGGLGFSYKWNMGWMNDILKYMEADPYYRKWIHHHLTFSFMYAFSENFVLPLSHDEVVHGKKSLLSKMPGDYWQKFANLRALYGYMMAHPGKKLLFMGGEFGQFIEWNDNGSLDWHLLEYDMHRMMKSFVKSLNNCYLQQQALWLLDDDWKGLEWIDHSDFAQSIIIFMRKTERINELVIVLCNFTPVVRHGYRFGVPYRGSYEEIFNTDWQEFGGSDQKNLPQVAQAVKWHSQPYSVAVTVPPLATVYFKVKI